MNEKCPKCGAEKMPNDISDTRWFICGSAVDLLRHPSELVTFDGVDMESEVCVRRQLTQAQERLAAVEAELALHENCGWCGQKLTRHPSGNFYECLPCHQKKIRQDEEIHLLRETKAGNWWAWQGDGSDRLETLTCPVLIQPIALANILNDLAGAEKKLAEIEAERGAALDRERKLRDVLSIIEWSNWTYREALNSCPMCERTQTSGHSDGCVIAAALATTESAEKHDSVDLAYRPDMKGGER